MPRHRKPDAKDIRTVILLLGMGLAIPCYLFTAGNVLISPWPLYGRNRLILAALTALCLAGLMLAFRAAEKREAFFARHEKKLLILFVLFYFIVQMLLGHILRFTPKTDAEQCFTAAQLLVDTGTFGSNERSWVYFTRCTNNLGFVYVLAAIFRFFGALGFTDRFMQIVFTSSALFSLGLICGARLVRRAGGLIAQIRYLIVTACCLPLLYCTTEIYTDGTSVAFPVIILYCAMRVHDAGKTGEKQPTYPQTSAFLWMILFAAASFIGSTVRFTAIIASIAAIIWLLFSRRALRAFASAAVLAAVMLTGNAAIDAENAKHLDPADMQARSLPIYHYIAMGLPVQADEGYGQYGDGGWYVFTTSFDDPEARDAALISEIIDRVYYLRYPNRLLHMMSRKNLSTFGDGTFLLNEIIEADDYTPDNPVKQVVFAQGALYPAYYHLCTAMFIAQMILCCAACAQAIRRRDTQGGAIFIALIGAFLLLCIWETRGRYFFQFEMLMLCAAGLFRAVPGPGFDESELRVISRRT